MHTKRLGTFFYTHRVLLNYLVIIVCAGIVFSWIQSTPTVADPDTFYHIRVSLQLPIDGIQKQFPWLQLSILRDTYADQHFLYHIYLLPFVSLMSPFLGAKVATIILNVTLITFFYWLLRRYHIPYAAVLALILLATMPFILRISLIKASGLSILLLLIGLHCVFQRKSKGLFVVSFLYVWAYGGFVLIVVVAGIHMLVSIIRNWHAQSGQRSLTRAIRHSPGTVVGLSAIGGVLAGMVINPYFPENVSLYWYQLVHIGIINYQSVIQVGNEWYAYSFIDLAANTAFVSILIIITLYVSVMRYRSPKTRTITMGLLALFFFGITLKSGRYVEYYVPFALIAAAFGLREHLADNGIGVLWIRIKAFWSRYRILATLLIIYLLIITPAIIIKDFRHAHAEFINDIPLDRFAGSSQWLADHSRAGDIVFHSSWTEFPMLYYYNQKNYYLTGLDPTFSYVYDADRYTLLMNITRGEQTKNIATNIKNTFNARFVFIDRSHTEMLSAFQAADGCTQVYADDEATIFEVL